jgi:ribosome-binding protein aMBF1 (putative translation factor)
MARKLRIEDTPTFEDALAHHLRDPEARERWERTALARAVAIAVVRFRAENSLSQRALAERLGWKQPQVARLELGETNPSIETLLALSRRLGLRFMLAVGPAGKPLPVRPRRSDVVERAEDDEGQLVAAVG